MNHSDHPLDPPLLAIDMYASSHISPGSLGSQSPSSISREAVSPGRAFDQSAQSENHALGLGEELVPSGHVSVSKVLAVDAHDPKYVDGLERTSSPTSLSNHSRDGSQGSDSSASAKRTMQLTNSYERKPISELEKDAFPGLNSPSSGEPRNTSNGQVNGTRDSHPYLMTAEKGGERAPSPGSPPLHSWNTSNGSMPPDQYAPDMIRNAHNPPLNAGMSSPASTFTWHDTQTTSSVGGKDRIGAPRGLSLSNGSAFSVSAGDPYAPSQHNRHSITEIPGYGSYSSSHNPYGHEVGLHKNLPPVYDQSGGQDLLAHRTQPLYAPSPSLLGSNDPLGRTAARVPVFSFGFGGKLVTCFHGSSVLNTGFDVALSSRKSMDIHIRVLNMIIPESALDTSTALFPGPLFSDPGTPTTSLVRTGSFAQIKAKKARLLKYLDERTAEISQGIGYLHPASGDRRKAEGKFVLVRLLKAMIENDGRLSGT
jgi:hypothetical protein